MEMIRLVNKVQYQVLQANAPTYASACMQLNLLDVVCYTGKDIA